MNCSNRQNSRRWAPAAALIGALALLASMSCAPAMASPSVVLHAGLQPATPGVSTNVSVGFRIATTQGRQPSQLRSFALQLPAGMGFFSSSLGLATCSQQLLLAEGAVACPSRSVMGFGNALVQAPFGTQGVQETAAASIFMTTPVDGHTTMLFYFDGRAPVIADIALPSEILTPSGTNDSVLSSEVPEIPTAPGAADLSILGLQVNIGPRDILYYKHLHGRTVAYHPTGLNVPSSCPRGGFLFTGSFGFQDGSHVHSSAAVACPAHSRRGGHSGSVVSS